MDDSIIKEAVKKRYSEIAAGKRQGCGCMKRESCCATKASRDNRLIDYGKEGEGIVDGADLGLGCGIPTRRADLRPGEVVLDLGSGAGIDAFLASRAVGPEGRVIGVDMTPEMVARARKNARQGGYKNVEFINGDIEHLPLDDASVDVVISNCVVNLVPDKRRAFAEIFRVLRPGGRFSISDLVTGGPVPENVRKDLEQWAGCVAGAMNQEDYLKLIDDAGFAGIVVRDAVEYDAFKGEGYSLMSITIEGKKP